MGRVVELVVNQPQSDVILTLDCLRADACAQPGSHHQLIGLAYIAMYAQRRFVADLVGVTRFHPQGTKAYMFLLERELEKIILGNH